MDKAQVQKSPAKTHGKQNSRINRTRASKNKHLNGASHLRALQTPNHLTSDHLSALHQSLGNRAVGRLIQAKLTIGEPDDKYEREADQVADKVMRMPEPASNNDDEATIQTKPLASRITPLIQRAPEDQPEEDETQVQMMPEEISEQDEEETIAAMPLAQRQPPTDDEEEEPVQTKLAIQRQVDEGEEEPVQAKAILQRQDSVNPEDEETAIQTKPFASQITPLVQRAPEDQPEEDESLVQMMPEEMPEQDEETVAAKPLVQRQPLTKEDEEVEPIEAKLEAGYGLDIQRQMEDEEEITQAKPLIQRQTAEDEEAQVQTKATIQRQMDEGEEEETAQAKPLIQRQVDEEGESLQAKHLPGYLTPQVPKAIPIPVHSINPGIQRVCTECEEEMQRQPVIQPKGMQGQSSQVSPSAAANIQSMNGGGKPLPRSARSFFEPRFGADFSGVRVHTDTRAAETAKSINARAFTVGRNIAFGAGEFAPETHAGRRLLGHELTHTLQQGHTVIQRKGENVPGSQAVFDFAQLIVNGAFNSSEFAEALAAEDFTTLQLRDLKERVSDLQTASDPLIDAALEEIDNVLSGRTSLENVQFVPIPCESGESASINSNAWVSNERLTGIAAGTEAPLKKGDQGEAVRLVQQALLQWGCKYSDESVNLLPRYRDDGDFGREMKLGVEEFQRRNGLTDDGVVGVNTLFNLQERVVLQSVMDVEATIHAEDHNKPVFAPYKGQSINKIGHISSPADQYKIVKSSGANVRAKPNGALSPIAKVVYDTEAQVRALDNTNAFYFIIAKTGVAGWINKDFVVLEPPDIGSRLHHITEGNLTTILKNEYIDKNIWSLGTGNDYTTLAAAVVVANEGRIGVSVEWDKVEEYKEDHKFKRMFDPWMIDNFAIYHGSEILSGHNIWLPSANYIRRLQKSGAIGSRPDWVNVAVDVGKGIAGFTSGVVSGIFGSLWDTLTGLLELGKGIVDTVKSVVDGSILASIESIYDTITGLTWEGFKKLVDEIITMGKSAFNDFQSKWCHPNSYKKWHFRGTVIGAIALEVILAIFTGGATLAAKVLAKIGKYLPKLMQIFNKLLVLAKKLPGQRRKGRADKPEKGKDRDRDRDKDDKDMSKDDRAWEQARALAAVVTEGHDTKDTPVTTLIPMLNTTIASRFKGVSQYKAIPKGPPSTYKIIQLARKNIVDKHYTGMLRGEQVELPGVAKKRIQYTKRPRAEYNRLRREFDSTVRKKFAKNYLAGDPKKIQQLKKSGLTDTNIALLKDGYIPKGYQVHHKIPLDDGGTNNFDNLILMKNEPYHKAITNSHNKAIKGMEVGDTRTIDYPIPTGFVYPP